MANRRTPSLRSPGVGGAQKPCQRGLHFSDSPDRGRVTVFLLFSNQSCLRSAQGVFLFRGVWGLVGHAAARPGREGRPRSPCPAPARPCLGTWKTLMPFISAFLSPVYLLEILFSLLKRRFCFPRGVGRGGSGVLSVGFQFLYVPGRRERRTSLSGKFNCAGQELVKLVPQGHLDLRS